MTTSIVRCSGALNARPYPTNDELHHSAAQLLNAMPDLDVALHVIDAVVICTDGSMPQADNNDDGVLLGTT